MLKSPLFIAYLFIYIHCFGQQYPFVHYTPKDGLVNSRVRKAFQDSKGIMYFMTFGGLSVYDGPRFTNYTIQNGLGADMINDIIEMGDDSLWISCTDIHDDLGSELSRIRYPGEMVKLKTSQQATQTNIAISVNHHLVVCIHDNGKGIDWKIMRPLSNGIINIKKRMKDTGGSVDFKNERDNSDTWYSVMN